MIDQSPAPIGMRGEDVCQRTVRRSLFPSLDRTLAIARIGSRDPTSLTREDIEDLSRAMLMQYARMGIH